MCGLRGLLLCCVVLRWMIGDGCFVVVVRWKK